MMERRKSGMKEKWRNLRRNILYNGMCILIKMFFFDQTFFLRKFDAKGNKRPYTRIHRNR